MILIIPLLLRESSTIRELTYAIFLSTLVLIEEYDHTYLVYKYRWGSPHGGHIEATEIPDLIAASLRNQTYEPKHPEIQHNNHGVNHL